MKIALLTSVVALVAGTAAAHGPDGHHGSHDMHESMMRGCHQMESMRMSGDVDRDFVKEMLMHHRHGVEMAKIQLDKGTDPKAKDFARKIIDEQNKEIEQLQGWLSEHPEKADQAK